MMSPHHLTQQKLSNVRRQAPFSWVTQLINLLTRIYGIKAMMIFSASLFSPLLKAHDQDVFNRDRYTNFSRIDISRPSSSSTLLKPPENPFNTIFLKSCIPQEEGFFEVGYYLNDEQRKWLTRKVWTPQSQNLERHELLRKISSFIKQHNQQIEADSLSELILQAADSIGIDPLILTALIRVESLFRPRAVSPTGAVGLTQMTFIAMGELRSQFGLEDPHFRVSLRTELIQMVGTFFQQDQRKTDEYLNFVEKSKDSNFFRTILLNNPIYSILSGALLFKLKLAISRGNYTRAIEAYNGSKIQKFYRAEVFSYRDQLKKVSWDCLGTRFAQSVLAWNCVLHAQLTQGQKVPDACYLENRHRIFL